MNTQDILDMIGDAKSCYIWDAQQVRNGTLTAAKKKIPVRKIWLIAAIIAMLLMLVGCAVAYVMSLQDLKIGENTTVRPEHYGPNWEVIEAEEKTYELISVQGFGNSPNQQAVREWMEYLKAWDAEAAEVSEAVKQKKLNEIAVKYGLKLLKDGIDVNYDQSQILLDALKLSGVCTGQDYAKVEYSSGAFHPEGTFDLWVNIMLNEDVINWPYAIRADFQYYRKGYFKYYYIGVENLDSFQEWEYALPGGEKALLALSGEDALILVEREDAYLSVHFDSRRGVDHMTPEMVEKIADLFDFSIVPHSLSDREMWEVRTEIRKLEDQQKQKQQLLQEQYAQSLKKEGFAGWVKETLENSGNVTDLGYAFLDIDGNGADDLLIGRDGYCTAIYWEVDGQTQQFSNAAAILYPCEDQVIGYVVTPWDTNYFFTKVENETSRGAANVSYVPGHPEGEYREYSLEVWNQYENITKEEFDSIMSSYVRIPVTFLPLTEYPLEEEAVLKCGESGLGSEDFESYAEKIRVRLTSNEEQWSRWAYDIRDLNGDGVEEMIWREDDRYSIYTIYDGKVSFYSMESDGSITVCEDGIVEAVHHYGPVNKTYRYYRIEDDRAVLVEYLRYDVDADPENPWFRSPDLSGQDITLESISTTEAMAVIASYEPLEPDMKPIADYPFE